MAAVFEDGTGGGRVCRSGRRDDGADYHQDEDDYYDENKTWGHRGGARFHGGATAPHDTPFSTLLAGRLLNLLKFYIDSNQVRLHETPTTELSDRFPAIWQPPPLYHTFLQVIAIVSIPDAILFRKLKFTQIFHFRSNTSLT